MRKPKIAVVLFNLGGPDRMESVRPFLLNLFRDPAILRVPFFVRPILARIIARARVKPAQENYALLGGKSPLLDLTRDQGTALEAALPELDIRAFIAMRYWHPFSEQTAREVKDWDPDEIVLLPLYPHYSTTTTGSSLTAWREAASKIGLMKKVTSICCYHADPGYLAAMAGLVQRSYDEARAALDPAIPLRILFSAHGLPEIIVTKGDPYQHQIEQTVAGTIANLTIPGLDAAICYQSRATPQKWIGPSTEEELERAGRDKTAVLIVPIAFVSEHSETLVELDVEYREFAHKHGVPGYYRTPAANSDPAFIEALATLVRHALATGPGLRRAPCGVPCPAKHKDCPHRLATPAAKEAA
jgi:ferrochelatase